MRIKETSTAPALVVRLTNDGAPVNLTTASSVTMIAKKAGEIVFEDVSPAVNALGGTVSHNWQTGDVDEAGRLWVEVRVVWADSTVQRFPAFGFIPVDIES